MPADWDADSARLRRNLAAVLSSVRDDAENRVMPCVAMAAQWQKTIMAGLTVPDGAYAGKFRGARGLENVGVSIDGRPALDPADVAGALILFESRLQAVVSSLDAAFAVGEELGADGFAAVIDLAAWAHSEWVRIHPFANGNGRTARIWANLVLMRYGIAPVIRLRPRPDAGYAAASASAMTGDWAPTAAVFRAMVRQAMTPVPDIVMQKRPVPRKRRVR